MVRQENHEKLLLEAVPKEHRKLIERAIEVAKENYSSTTRLSGEPLLNHLLRSARYYAELKIDINGIVATLLHHKIPEEQFKKYKDVFSEDVITLLRQIETTFSFAKRENIDNKIIHKYILSFNDDVRIAIIKLTEKYDNAKTIDLLTYEKQMNVAQRLLSIYTPLAEYLNLMNAKNEFELHGFRVVYPEEYARISTYLYDKQEDLNQGIVKLVEIITTIVGIVNVNAQIWGRKKTFYSIWRKLTKYGKENKSADISSMNDLLAFKVVVDSIEQCYAVAYAIKDYVDDDKFIWEDYILNPKLNGFKQIQVVCRFPEFDGVRVEIQILTSEMYWFNEYGPASHVAYKLSGKRFPKSSTEFQWIEEVHKEMEKNKNSEIMQLSNPLKLGLFSNSIFTFTPGNKIIELTKESTGIDFAYQIHSQIGDMATFVKVNGVVKPLSIKLNNGDVVEVITDSKKLYPTEGWLEFAQTGNAIAFIKAGLRRKSRV